MSPRRVKAVKPPQAIQTTPTGYEIPVPQRSDVLGALRKAMKPQKQPERAEGEGIEP
jgi:hypothetical protein